VYDLGGGTFDVSILKLTEGVFKVIATTGNTALGGDDFDYAMVSLLSAGLSEADAAALDRHPQGRVALKMAAERAKIALSDQEATSVKLKVGDVELDATITRAAYEAAIGPILDKTFDAIDFVLDESGLDPEDINDIVCVGGSTRTPLVRRRLEEHFDKPPQTDIDPDQVVALGAALQAAMLAGTHAGDGTVLLDVTPLSLGIETYGGGCSKLIWRNSTIPIRATEGYTTQVDDQTSVDIHVLQGEREMAKDLRSLGRFKLRGFPRMKAGMPRLLVEFFIDANGILRVQAKEMTSGVEAGIEVTPTYGLTDEQVEDMIFESIEHAEEDIEEHLLADLRIDAGSAVRYSRKVIVERPDLVPPPLKIAIEASIAGLEAALEGTDREVIEAAMEVLNECTGPVASDLMNEVLKVTVHGKTMGEVLGTKRRTLASEIQLT
jgi:molecular chaperone DnaK (HSP70)